jgi:RecA/RadA recombinase
MQLRSGSPTIDALLKDGLPMHRIALVYGEAAAGKTLLALHYALKAAQDEFKVFYVDSDLSFSAQRLGQLPGGIELADRIVIFRPDDFSDQMSIIEGVEGVLTKSPALLVIDSITGLYRVTDDASNKVFARSRALNRQLAYLNDLAVRFELRILITGQVHSSPSGRQWMIEPVATRSLLHWSYLVLRLRHTARSDVRECIVEKIKGREVGGPRALFRIGDEGIEAL